MSEPSPWGKGTVVDQRYRLESKLGEGTFGAVWRAEDRKLGDRPVALKQLKAAFLSDAGIVQRFDDEAMALAHLQHPNVVGVLDRGTFEGRRYIVTELVEGESLDRWLDDHRARGVVPELDSVREIFLQVCAGVHAAHCVQRPGPIVHRDLKPHNILVGRMPDGAPLAKVLDFGIAQLGSRRATQTGQVLGTLVYMAPEQAFGRAGDVGPWTDVFSLAVILVEMLTLTCDAGDGESWWGSSLSGRDGVHGALEGRRDDVPREVWRQVALAMSQRGEERPRDAGVLARRIAAAFEGESSRAASTVSARRGAAREAGPTGEPPVRMAPIERAPTPPPPTRVSAPLSEAPARTEDRAPGRARAPALVALGVVVVGGAVATGFLLGGQGSDAASSGAPASPALPAPPPPEPAAPAPVARGPACPTGMVLVEGGTFRMGEDGPQAPPLTSPAHEVNVSTFCLNAHEVRASDYRTCAEAGGCLAPEARVRSGGLSERERRYAERWCNGVSPERASHPMNCVGFDQAAAYCRHRGARLPTEAEWEFAARGTEGRSFPWGEDPPGGRLNACGEECREAAARAGLGRWPALYGADDGFPGTAPVGSFPEGDTVTGLSDMAGNVWEWTATWYDLYAFDRAPRASGTHRVTRGGGFTDGVPRLVRASVRGSLLPDTRDATVGFRCAADPVTP